MNGPTPQFAPLNALPAYKLLAAEIGKMIMAGALRPGDPVPTEAVLCEQFSVTRSTVREGIRLLEETGLVRRSNSKRLVISQPSTTEVSRHAERAMLLQEVSFLQLWEAAMMLEPQAARHAATNLLPEDLERLADNLHRTEQALLQGEPLVALDIEFHALVAGAVHNTVLLLAREPMARLFYPAFEVVMDNVPSAGKRLLKAHQDIVSALTNRLPPLAAEVMEKHIIDFRRGFELAGRDLLSPARQWAELSH